MLQSCFSLFDIFPQLPTQVHSSVALAANKEAAQRVIICPQSFEGEHDMHWDEDEPFVSCELLEDVRRRYTHASPIPEGWWGYYLETALWIAIILGNGQRVLMGRLLELVFLLVSWLWNVQLFSSWRVKVKSDCLCDVCEKCLKPTGIPVTVMWERGNLVGFVLPFLHQNALCFLELESC